MMLAAARMSTVCSVPPLETVSVPPSTSTKLPTVADPPLMVSPPVWQLHRQTEIAADVQGARQRERAGSRLGERAVAAVLNRAAHRGRKVVAADDEPVRAKLICAGALDRTGGDVAVAERAGGAGEVDGAAGIGDQAGVAAVTVAGELRQRAAVGGNGRVAGGAGVGKRNESGAAAVVDDGRISGGARVGKRYRAVVGETRRERGIVHNT